MDKRETLHLRDALRLFGRLTKLIRPYWSQLSKGILIGFFLSLIAMGLPYLTKLLIDEVYPSRDVSLMHVLVGGILAISVGQAMMRMVQGYYTLHVNSRLSNAVRLLFFNHLQHLPMRFFDEHRVGEVTSRFGDVGNALSGVTSVFQALFVQGMYLLLVPPFLFLLQWKLALVAIITVPLTAIVTGFSAGPLRKYWKQSSEAHAALSAIQVESLSHIRAIKTLALERYIYKKARTQMNHAVQMQLRAGGLSYIVRVSDGVLRALNTALITWLGWTFILAEQMTLGSYIAFSAYVGYMYRPISQLVGLFSNFQQSAVHLNRMFEYLDAPTEQEPIKTYMPVPPVSMQIRGSIAIEEMSFGYTSDAYVLHGINLEISASSITAIVGASGSGKTTLFRLLTHLEQPDAGLITIDGRPLDAYSLSDLRRQIAVVWQEFSLLKGTIWENLTIGLTDVRRDSVENAVRLCHIEDLIHNSPSGYDTPVAEWGASLSGGQRQRIAIARALIRDTPILLLDEATSNVDVETEAAILRDLFPVLEGKTVIFVTHRVTTASLADQISVLEDGCVVDIGTHEQLLLRCDSYKRMHHSDAGQNLKRVTKGNGAIEHAAPTL